MPTLTLRPASDVIFIEWTDIPVSPTTHYTSINEAVADDDTSYILSNIGTSPDRDVYGKEQSGLASAQVIDEVRLYARSRTNGMVHSVMLGFLKGATLETSPTTLPAGDGTYATDLLKTYTVDPFLGGAITAGQLDPWRLDIRSTSFGTAGAQRRVTQIYLEIDYTIVAPSKKFLFAKK